MDDRQPGSEQPLQGLRAEYPLGNCVTPSAWQDSGKPAPGGASAGRWMEDAQIGRTALMKPGAPQANRLEPVREWFASVVASWLNVRVPTVELYIHPAGPAALSMMAGQSVFTWQQVMNDPALAQLRPTAMQALQSYAPILVLDSIVGVQDRNENNALYVAERDEWYSIDYSYSFGLSTPTGIGDPDQYHETGYPPQFLQAVTPARDAIQRIARNAADIPEDAFRALVSAPPALFATALERRSMLSYMLHRRSNIHGLLTRWCERHGLGPVQFT